MSLQRYRLDFPILHQLIRGKPLVYLDNAATAQKPASVLAAVEEYYERDNANVHRGVHTLSVRATEAYEGARARVRRFLNAAHDHEVIFTRGTTEAINLVANSYGARLKAGDEILITWMEHHSNIVPWQMLCERTGAVLRVARITDAGELDRESWDSLLGERTRIVAFPHVSNSLGTINPAAELIAKAHSVGAIAVVDGAQAVPHAKVDVAALGADFYAFSGHKLFGPTGIGVLYGRERLLESMPPWQGGGDMIASVTFEKSTYAPLPNKFEAGTPHISGAVGLAAAIDYVEETVGYANIAAWEHELLEYGTALLSAIPEVRLIGTAREKAAVISFVVDGIHPHDIGTFLDGEGIAVRTGHHCTQPIMDRFGVPATTRASMAFYNTREEMEALAEGVRKVVEFFK